MCSINREGAPDESGVPSMPNDNPGTSAQWSRRTLRKVSPRALKTRIGPPAIKSPFKVTSASAPPVISSGPVMISVGRCSFAARNSSRTPASSAMLGVSSNRPLSLNSTTPPAVRASSAGWIGPGEATVSTGPSAASKVGVRSYSPPPIAALNP